MPSPSNSPQDDRTTPGPDGHRARLNGAYAETKLSFLNNYLGPALIAAQRKPQRTYVDLFAGPGLNRDRASHRFYEAAALRALQVGREGGVAFTDAILVNLDREDHAALTARVDALEAAGQLAIPRDRVRLVRADANRVVQRLDRVIGRYAYAFAYVDPENPGQWPWASVEALARTAPPSTDLYALVPDVMGYHRLLAYDPARLAPLAPALTRFFGTEAWREHWAQRATAAQAPQLRKALADLYREQIGTLWPHVRTPRRVCRTGNAALYSMLFGTRHPAALRLCEWEAEAVTSATPTRQGDLFGALKISA